MECFICHGPSEIVRLELDEHAVCFACYIEMFDYLEQPLSAW